VQEEKSLNTAFLMEIRVSPTMGVVFKKSMSLKSANVFGLKIRRAIDGIVLP
jgi:hypothetical protein